MTVERDVAVMGELGLHARPAVEFAEAAARFDARITVSKGARDADAASVLMILTLDVRQGDRIHLRADGPQAEEAIEQLTALVSP